MEFLKNYGLNSYWKDKFNINKSLQSEMARVVTCFNGKYILIATKDGLRKCIVPQKILKSCISPVPGDWVIVKEIENNSFVLTSILDRKSIFYRKKPNSIYEEQIIGVNLDKLFLVTSMNKEYNPRRLERFIVQAQKCQIELIIVLSKADLVQNTEVFIEMTRKIFPIGNVLAVSSFKGVDGLKSLSPFLIPGETIGFVGASGVGKSTIINTLIGSTNLEVGEINKNTSKGRHTTTRRELVLLNNGTVMLDTPGMREFGIMLEGNDHNEGFSEILEWSKYCEYSDCQHKNEEGCAVKGAVNNGIISDKRLNNYHKITHEQNFLWVKGRRIKKSKLKYKKNNKEKIIYKRQKNINFEE